MKENKKEVNKTEENNKEQIGANAEPKKDGQPLDLNDFEDAPMLPQDDESDYDLQKELEAKFDELFGPIDD